MLTNQDQYRRARAVVNRLGRKVKDGSATEEDRTRYQAGVDHCLIYEWAEEGGTPTKPKAQTKKTNKLPPPVRRYASKESTASEKPTGTFGGLSPLRQRATHFSV